MLGKNPEAMAIAYKRALAVAVKINELGITPATTAEEVNVLIELLAKAKSADSGKDWTTHVKGMRWYVEDLVKVSGMNAIDRLDYEYQRAFPDVASEDEMANSLQAIIDSMATPAQA